jgi:hypothetical protein
MADTFPILRLGNPRARRPDLLMAVPWPLIAPHDAQAVKNHGQTLRRLAERGGLAPYEMCAVLEDRRWGLMGDDVAEARLTELVDAWEATHG